MGIDGGQPQARTRTTPTSWYRMSGGYADTYIHFKTNRVFKFCHKYFMEESSSAIHIIHYSTVCDLVYSKVLMGLQGFPKLHAFEIGDTQIKMEMDYLGKTLHDACQTYTKQTRWALASKLLDYLIRTNFNLWYNGLQHTDIKPGNILIDSRDQFHLIDFNCMSIRWCGAAGASGASHWAPAIGTWHYVAPEILMTGTPVDNSMIWSIGMVMAHWLCGEYPISQERMKRYIQRPASSQQDWRALMTAIRKKYPEGLQLEQVYIQHLGGWWEKLRPLLRWSRYKRWNLERVFQMNSPAGIQPHLHVRNLAFPANPLRVPDYVRESVLQKGLRFLQAIAMEWTLVNAMSLFDRSYPLEFSNDSKKTHLWFICCWAIQGYLTNDFLFDNDSIVFAVHSHYHLTCDIVMNHIYTVLAACDALAWQKDWQGYLPVARRDIQWQTIQAFLIRVKEEYTPETVAEFYKENAI